MKMIDISAGTLTNLDHSGTIVANEGLDVLFCHSSSILHPKDVVISRSALVFKSRKASPWHFDIKLQYNLSSVRFTVQILFVSSKKLQLE
jgi:hypothetical protein